MTSPYHAGELAVQDRAGVRAMAAKIGAVVDDAISPPAAGFLAKRYTIYVGSVAADGSVWASQLIGAPGFVQAIDEHTVRIDAAASPGDPVLANLRADPRCGLLAIDVVKRRRFRVNGTATVQGGDIVVVRVAQAYGNCPKYIQSREPVGIEQDVGSGGVADGTVLSASAQALVTSADTFFLATAHPTAGADVSHRGGKPGFVRVVDARTLEWPDYAGNTMFMSLGNLEVDPRAGLLFVEFEGGRTVQVTGRARVDWDSARAAAAPGAERFVVFTVERVVESERGNPVRWRLLEPSPFNP